MGLTWRKVKQTKSNFEPTVSGSLLSTIISHHMTSAFNKLNHGQSDQWSWRLLSLFPRWYVMINSTRYPMMKANKYQRTSVSAADWAYKVGYILCLVFKYAQRINDALTVIFYIRFTHFKGLDAISNYAFFYWLLGEGWNLCAEKHRHKKA